MGAAEHFDANHIHTTPEGRHFRHGDGIEVDGEGNPLWVEYLKNRCQEDGIECLLSDSEIYDWVAAGVGSEDNASDVFAAFCESLAGE